MWPEGAPVVRLSLLYVSALKSITKPLGRLPAGPTPPIPTDPENALAHTSWFVLDFEMYLLFPQQPGWIPLCLVFRPNSQKQKETP
jgi:hypothetical protein